MTFVQEQIEKHCRAIFNLSRDGTDDDFHTSMSSMAQVMFGICMATTTPKKLFQEYLEILQRSLHQLPDIHSKSEAKKIVGVAAKATDGSITEIRSMKEGFSIQKRGKE